MSLYKHIPRLAQIRLEKEMQLALNKWTALLANNEQETSIVKLIREAVRIYSADVLLRRMPGQPATALRGRVSCPDFTDFWQKLWRDPYARP